MEETQEDQRRDLSIPGISFPFYFIAQQRRLTRSDLSSGNGGMGVTVLIVHVLVADENDFHIVLVKVPLAS